MDNDRNLLFAALTHQADLIDADQFARACALWAADKDRPLAELIVAQGWITPADRADVEKLLARKLRKHGGDPSSALAEATTDSIRNSLAGLDDPVLRAATSTLMPPTQSNELVRTAAFAPEARERYTLARLHATGGLGRVWVAHDGSLGRDVALKELRPERAGDPATWSRFLKEARITGQLEHPGIVPVYELVTPPLEKAESGESKQPFYTMRFVRGRTLAAAIQSYRGEVARGGGGPLGLQKLLNAFVGVCHAVAYAHSRGVLHRDLKPQNIVLGDYGEVMVLDWGLAKVLGEAEATEPGEQLPVALTAADSRDQTVQGQVLGTPSYMPPEQAEGRLQQMDVRSDVYGLGAVLYHLLAGVPPFTGDVATAVLQKVIHEAPLRPRELARDAPPALEAVCLKALAKKPAERYASVSQLRDDVQHWLADEPVSAYHEPLRVQASRFTRRHRLLVTSAALLLITTVVGLTIGLAAVERERGHTARERDEKAKALAAESKALEAETQARQLTMNALRKLTDTVVDEHMARRTLLTDEDRRFLRDIQRQYEEFAALTGEEGEQRAMRAAGRYRVGLMQYRLGELKEAEDSYRQAVALLQPLVAEFPNRHEFRRELAACHGNLGNLLHDKGRWQEAESAQIASRALWRELVAEFPTKPEYRYHLAITLDALGRLLRVLDRRQEAETAHNEALAIRRQLIVDFPGWPEYRARLAEGLNTLGSRLREQGKRKEEEAAYVEALGILEGLAADYPARPEHRESLAATHNFLGPVYRATGRPEKAEAAYGQALVLFRQLAAEFPARPGYRQLLASGHNNLGVLYQSTGRLQEAETAYNEAIALLKPLAAGFPTNRGMRRELSAGYNNLSILLRELGRTSDAETANASARAIEKELAAELPAVAESRESQAHTLNNRGNRLSDAGKSKEAETAYMEALAMRRRLIVEFPAVARHHNDLAGTLVNLAILSAERRDFAQARRWLEEAEPHHQAALKTDPKQARYRQFYRNHLRVLARICAGLGDQAAALQAAAKLRDLGWDPPGDAYHAACALALCGSVVETNEHLDSAQRDKQVQFYGDQAIEYLRDALAKGYEDAARMKADPSLDSLRKRADFQKLLADLEAKAKGEKK